jgi:asparagine synthase (glutamine-hydrolysing)
MASRGLPDGIPGSNFLKHLDWPYARYVLNAMAVFPTRDRDQLFSNDARRALSGSDAYANSLAHLRDSASTPWASRMMEYDLKTYLPNDILTKVDRMSMLNSLEAREPLLDHRLVEFAARIPARLKVSGKVSKYILKQAIAPYLPPAVMTKPKQGFSIPLDTWLRGDLRDDVLDTVRGGNREGIFDSAAVTRIVDEFYRGDARRNHQVWSLYALEKWHQLVHCRTHTTSRGSM